MLYPALYLRHAVHQRQIEGASLFVLSLFSSLFDRTFAVLPMPSFGQEPNPLLCVLPMYLFPGSCFCRWVYFPKSSFFWSIHFFCSRLLDWTLFSVFLDNCSLLSSVSWFLYKRNSNSLCFLFFPLFCIGSFRRFLIPKPYISIFTKHPEYVKLSVLCFFNFRNKCSNRYLSFSLTLLIL